MSLETDFLAVYTKFKMYFYREIFSNREEAAENLTTVEAFCMEVIHAMKRPTINEFASYIRISQPNAAYKVNNLQRKGFLRKIHSTKDKREYFLEVTQKYTDSVSESASFMKEVIDKTEARLSPEEKEVAGKVLRIMAEEMDFGVPTFVPKNED
ncbi:MAG: MarR family transcriptional regulator [Lachnospiraceae bacterium]|nr:MarR family transcriptional regulator [Lachnospiraceae bacterium]